MENFFNYLTKPILPEDVLVWFEANNIIYEKLELFSDFSLSLYDLIIKTYLGESDTPNDTKITLTEEDKEKHFDWCWIKLLNNFEKEGIKFSNKGEHYEYYKSFFFDIFYDQKDEQLRNSVGQFFNELFDMDKGFTKSDLDMVSTIYKFLDKSIKKV
jgi:hypothetical protein